MQHIRRLQSFKGPLLNRKIFARKTLNEDEIKDF